MKEIRFGRKDNKDVISVVDTETNEVTVIGELVIPWKEAQKEVTDSIKDYITKYGQKVNF